MAGVDDDAVGIVIDNGSGNIKAGFSGDDGPRAVFPTLVGRPGTHKQALPHSVTAKAATCLTAAHGCCCFVCCVLPPFPSRGGRGSSCIVHKDALVGSEAHAKRSLLSLKHPVEKGVVTDWNDMQKVNHTWFGCARTHTVSRTSSSSALCRCGTTRSTMNCG